MQEFREGLKSPERFSQAVLKSFAGPVIFFRISGDLPALVPISTNTYSILNRCPAAARGHAHHVVGDTSW